MSHRIWIKGASGSGKTTLAKEVARRPGLDHVELDALHHDRGWAAAPAGLLRLGNTKSPPSRGRFTPRPLLEAPFAICDSPFANSTARAARAMAATRSGLLDAQTDVRAHLRCPPDQQLVVRQEGSRGSPLGSHELP